MAYDTRHINSWINIIPYAPKNFIDRDDDNQQLSVQDVLNDEDDNNFSVFGNDKDFKHIVDGNSFNKFLFTPLNNTNDDNEISAQEAHQCNGENQKLDEDCQNVGNKNDGVDKNIKRDGTNQIESNELQQLRLENMMMKAHLKEYEEQQQESFEYYETLLDESNNEKLK